jgi:hypothetical protein
LFFGLNFCVLLVLIFVFCAKLMCFALS